MRVPVRVLVLLAAVVAACAALPGSLPAGGVAGRSPGAAPPWRAAGPLPARYDPRVLGLVVPVRSQGRHGTCWAMAALGSLETAILREEGTAPDFSENALTNHSGSKLYFGGWATSELATAYLARWDGPVLEADDPYPAPARSPDFLRAVRHVGEVLFLPARTGPLDNAAVKWAVSRYGAVDAALDFDVDVRLKYWDPDTAAYYATRDQVDHHVCVVGWDDAYPAASFATRPPGDGAFLIRNSWGADFGDGGYFWLSYYDAGFGRQLAVFDGAAPADDHDAIYQHDPLGRSGWLGLGGEDAWFASRFRCVGTGSLSAVSFYTPVPGATYEVRVARSAAGIASAPVAASGAIAVGGYHTVGLSLPAQVAAGDWFVVAVHVVTPGWSAPVPVERPTGILAPDSAPGRSYVSADGRAWQDLTARPGLQRADVCLKAFVDASGAGDVEAPEAGVTAVPVGAGGRASVRWSLRDAPFSCASATLVLEVRDADGAAMARRRIPAAVVGEHGRWTFSARWPAGAYTVTARAFDVAGHLQATPGRATLTVLPSAQRSARPAR